MQSNNHPPVFDVVIDRFEGELARIDDNAPTSDNLEQNKSQEAQQVQKCEVRGIKLRYFRVSADSENPLSILKDPTAIKIFNVVFITKYIIYLER